MLYHGYGSKLGTPIVGRLYILKKTHVESVAPKVLNYAYTQSVYSQVIQHGNKKTLVGFHIHHDGRDGLL